MFVINCCYAVAPPRAPSEGILLMIIMILLLLLLLLVIMILIMIMTHSST